MKFIFSISFIIISIILFFAVSNPLYGEVKQLRIDVATYNIALNNSTELQKTRDALIESYKNIRIEDRDRLMHFLPSTIGNIELILEIEKIANLHGMPIKNIKFDTKSLESTDTSVVQDSVVVAQNDPADYLPYGIFPMEFIIEGRYEVFTSFLKDLERNLRLVDVKSISFNVNTPSAVQLNVPSTNINSYTLKVETYWLK
jgi:Tfp pilus assembly protein PilO